MKRKEMYFCFFLVLVLCAIVLWPLALPGFFVTDDGEWMIIRLSAFFQSFREGQFPVRFLGRLNHEYGYPVANFLYPGFLYLGSFIHVLGISFTDTIKIIFAGSVVGSSWFLFLWLRLWFSSLASILGVAAFVFSPYLLFDLYTRGSVGEILAFLPAVVGLYSIEKNNKPLLSLAVAGLIVSHNTLALLFIGVFIARIFLRKKFSFYVPLLLGAGMSAFFWFPALYERRFVIFDDVIIANPFSYFITWDRSLRLGAVSLMAFLTILFSRLKKHTRDQNFFMIMFGLSILLSTPLFEYFWRWNILAKFIQFPYRFLSISIIFGSWLVAFLTEHTKKHRRLLFFLFAFFWVTTVVSSLIYLERTDKPEGFYTTNEGTTTVGDEYMPRWVKTKPTIRPVTKFEFVSGHGTVTPKTITTQKYEADVTIEDKSILQINSLYYPGWGVTLDGVWTPVDFDNPRGVMRITIPSGSHSLVVQFRETPIRLVIDIFSLLCGVVVVLLAVTTKKQYTNRK